MELRAILKLVGKIEEKYHAMVAAWTDKPESI